MHIYVRIEPRWAFDEVRRAALAVARDVERRVPALATSKWWKEERHGVFLDYNQNAKDRTIAAAYSVRARPDARVSAPLAWDEVADCEPEALHPGDDAGARRPRWRSARRHGSPAGLTRAPAGAGRSAGRRRPGRRAVAAALPATAGRAAAGGAVAPAQTAGAE